MIALLLLSACGEGASDAALYSQALSPELSLEAALEACDAMTEGGDECTATVVRQRPQATGAACEAIAEARWREECHFSVAERLVVEGDRWEAILECGRSGRYYDECLYHLWSRELQAAADPPGEPGDEPTRAVDRLPEAREALEFWSGIRTVAQDPDQLLWDDWWYFAHGRNRPADLRACDELSDEGERDACVRGTRRFVERYVSETMIRPNFNQRAKDRACRSGPPRESEMEGMDPAERVPMVVLDGLYVSEPSLDVAALRGLANACSPEPARPWNPVFRPLPESADVFMPADGAPMPDGPPPADLEHAPVPDPDAPRPPPDHHAPPPGQGPRPHQPAGR